MLIRRPHAATAGLVMGALLALALLTLGAGGAAAATPAEVTTYEVHACSPLVGGGLAPAGGEGVLLRLCSGSGTESVLVNLLPSGQVVQYGLPSPEPGPMVAGPAGEVWAVVRNGLIPASEFSEVSLDRLGPDGSVSTVLLGKTAESPFRALEVYGLVPDGQGGVWVATGELTADWIGSLYNSNGGELVHVGADGTMTRFPVPDAVEPQALVRGPDGNLWFTGVSGRSQSEHVTVGGRGWVGRMTPAGAFSLFAVPTREPALGGIGVGPDGRLWFVETGFNRSGGPAEGLGTIGVDGTFGPRHKLPYGGPLGPLTFGPEGDAWFSSVYGVVRRTGASQETVYPRGRFASWQTSIVTGPEGDIWSLHNGNVARIVPGGPGIELRSIKADRKAGTISFTLACGGASAACAGTLTLGVKLERVRTGTSAKNRSIRLWRTAYSVPAESTVTRTLHVPDATFERAHRLRSVRNWKQVIVRVTVAGGPTLKRYLPLPSLVGAG